jgi:DNA-binding CsgD family transcriptional regulator/pimeloyl-ACP methyl ester carboxylesterase
MPRVSEHRIGYATAADGERIAFSVTGSGFPLLYLAIPLLSHCLLAWEQPWFRKSFEPLASAHRLVLVDLRGSGLSSREVSDFSLATLVDDVGSVVRAIGAERIDLFASSVRSPVAVNFAANNRATVRRLVLTSPSLTAGAWVTGARGLRAGDFEFYLEVAAARIGAVPSDVGSVAAYMRQCTTQSSLLGYLDAVTAFESRESAARLTCPTLVLARPHGMNAAAARDFARSVPQAQLVVLPSDDTMIAGGLEMSQHVGRFLPPEPDFDGNLGAVMLTARELDVLRLIVEGSTNDEIADRLAISVRTVERHITALYTKTGSRGRADTAAWAVRNGLA